jgi:preprotein translocase subunit SecE
MSKDDNTWLNVAYICFALLIAYVAFKAIEMAGIQSAWIERYEWYYPAAQLGSLVIGALTTFWVRRDKNRNEYLLSSITELRKVTWPTWSDTKRMTLVVCVVVGIFAVILSIFDFAWARVLKVLLT